MIGAVFAVDKTNGMGYDNRLSWPHNPDDMRHFKSLTDNQVVAMGKRTWSSSDMPSPLPNRLNVLFTNNFLDREDIFQARGDIPTALKKVQMQHADKNVFVIGGPNILMQAKPVLQRIYLTRIDGEYMNDTYIDLDMFLEGFAFKKSLRLTNCTIEIYNKA